MNFHISRERNDVMNKIINFTNDKIHSICGPYGNGKSTSFIMLAKEFKVINPDDAFVIGFLHDIGKMLLNIKNPLKYSKVKYLAQQGNVSLVDVEDAQFGTNHCILGALISKKWQLPVILTNCIRYHHDPTQSSLPAVCGIVYIADRMVQNNMPTPLLEPRIMNKLEFTINDPIAMRETIVTKAQIFLKEMSGP